MASAKEKVIEESTTASGSATGNPRNKVALLPGHSLMDWIRLGNSGKDLTSVGGKLRDVTVEELAQHGELHNAWIAVRGRVYNVAPYMNFHPGGVSELMRGVGTDATDLFSEIHPWVNFESILQKCLVGRLVKSKTPATSLDLERAFFASLPALPPPTPQPPTIETTHEASTIKMSWCQTTQHISFTFKTAVSSPHIVITIRPERRLRLLIRVKKKLHVFSFALAGDVTWPPRVSVNTDTGRVEVELTKQEEDCWTTYGTNDADHGTMSARQEHVQEVEAYHKVHIVNIIHVTRDVRTFVFKFVEPVVMWVPLGHDLRIRAVIQGVDCARQYTPVPAFLPHCVPLKSWRQDYICCMVKHYENGALTPYIFSKKEWDVVEVGGLSGVFDLRCLAHVQDLYLIAAGSGITPMLRLIVWGLARKDSVKVHLLFMNRHEDDIILKAELDTLASIEKTFHVTYCLSKPGPGWKGLTGRLNSAMLDEFLPEGEVTPQVYVCACGPMQFTETLQKTLVSRGYGSNSFCFLG